MFKISRRAFLAYGLSLSVMSQRFGIARAEEDNVYSDSIAASKWMDELFKRAVINPLRMSRFADPVFFTTDTIGWRPDTNQPNYARVTVPTGFVTDFASIPRIFWSVLRPDGNYAYAAVIHDYLYWEQSRIREEADMIFKLAMEDFKITSGVIQTLFTAVRIGGGRAWDSNADLKAKGERRILKRFPADPRVLWKDWKLRNDVF